MGNDKLKEILNEKKARLLKEKQRLLEKEGTFQKRVNHLENKIINSVKTDKFMKNLLEGSQGDLNDIERRIKIIDKLLGKKSKHVIMLLVGIGSTPLESVDEDTPIDPPK